MQHTAGVGRPPVPYPCLGSTVAVADFGLVQRNAGNGLMQGDIAHEAQVALAAPT